MKKTGPAPKPKIYNVENPARRVTEANARQAYAIVRDAKGKVVKAIGFDPIFPASSRERFGEGHQQLEHFMVTHPGEPVQRKALEFRHKTPTGTLETQARKILRAHGLPPRKIGRPMLLPEGKIVERAFRAAGKNSRIEIFDLLFRIWKETGKVHSPQFVSYNLKKLSAQTGKPIEIGFRNTSAFKGAGDFRRMLREANRRKN